MQFPKEGKICQMQALLSTSCSLQVEMRQPDFADLVRGFEKGLADRGDWGEEILPMPEIQASFCTVFLLVANPFSKTLTLTAVIVL